MAEKQGKSQEKEGCSRWLAAERQVDRLFQDLIHSGWKRCDPPNGNHWSPNLELAEEDKCYVIEMEVPGLTREEIEVTVRGETILIRGERRRTRGQAGHSVFVTERHYGRFSRTFHLPEDVDGEHIETTVTEGVLRIVLPKRRRPRGLGKEFKRF